MSNNPRVITANRQAQRDGSADSECEVRFRANGGQKTAGWKPPQGKSNDVNEETERLEVNGKSINQSINQSINKSIELLSVAVLIQRK